MKERLEQHKVEKLAGFKLQRKNRIPVIKPHQYCIEKGITVSGDAPKAFMRIYEYNKCRKSNLKTWPQYIVKTGHKWYPTESLTEYLLNQLDLDFGLKMAESRLAIISGQLRFMSKYFLTGSNCELVHGAEIFAGYIGDRQFVENIEEKHLSKDLFTLQFVENAVEYLFPMQKSTIMCNLIKMLIFDALVGNNDRHFYNWGVVRTADYNNQPTFSPIYDTARGLFWNESEQKVHELLKDQNRFLKYLEKYTDNSAPKIGWDRQKNINHYKLVEKIYHAEFYFSKSEIRELLLQNILHKMLYTVNTLFKNYLSNERRLLITKCLELRYSNLYRIVNQ